jgi:hypothetical protein
MAATASVAATSRPGCLVARNTPTPTVDVAECAAWQLPTQPATAGDRRCASLPWVGLSRHIVSGPTGPLVRIWAAECDSPTDFSSIASVNPGIGFARIGGHTAVHLRGPATRASTLSCPGDTEYFGVDFRVGAYLPRFPPASLANLRDAVLPTPDGRILLDGQDWEMPTPMNLDVFVDRLVRAGLLVVDPLIDDLRHGDVRALPERAAQSASSRPSGSRAVSCT